MNAKPPLISVILPAYNAGAHIRQTLESALAQTYRAIEVIVVDDGSTDNTPSIVEEFIARDHRVRLIRQNNAGVGASRNTGIRCSCGEYIAPLDADDLWVPTKLEKQMAQMREGGPKTGMVCCGYRIFQEAPDTPKTEVSYKVGEHVRLRCALIYNNLVGNGSVPLFRKSAVEKAGYYVTREEQKGAQGCEDWCLGIRIAEEWEIRFVSECLVNYRCSGNCMSLDTKAMGISYRICMREARLRNRDLPKVLFKWSESIFYRYLHQQSYLAKKYFQSAFYLVRAISCDPVMLIALGTYKLILKSAFRIVMGSSIRRSHAAVAGKAPPKNTQSQKFFLDELFEIIQHRRWILVLNEFRH